MPGGAGVGGSGTPDHHRADRLCAACVQCAGALAQSCTGSVDIVYQDNINTADDFRLANRERIPHVGLAGLVIKTHLAGCLARAGKGILCKWPPQMAGDCCPQHAGLVVPALGKSGGVQRNRNNEAARPAGLPGGVGEQVAQRPRKRRLILVFERVNGLLEDAAKCAERQKLDDFCRRVGIDLIHFWLHGSLALCAQNRANPSTTGTHWRKDEIQHRSQ